MYRKTIAWPQGYKCAALVTVNLDAEEFWLRLDSNVIKMPKTLSMGQYGMTNGLPRVLDVLKVKNIKATFFVPGKVAERYSKDIKDVAAAGHEIACRGYALENMGLLSEEEQREAIVHGFDAIEKCCGVKPKGFRAPNGELTVDTLRIVKETGMFYSSSLSDDDRPYWKDLGDDRILEIPAHWVMYDLPYFAFNYRPAFPNGQGRIANYTGVINNWKDEFDGYHEYGLCYVLQIDPQTIGNPARISILEEILDYINALGNTWFATGSEIYEYFSSNWSA